MEPLFRTIVPPFRLGELLLRIGRRRLTGRLQLTSDIGERTVYFHTGWPVFAHSSQFSERLGAVGVRYGIVKREDVASALTLAREQSTELGRAMLELGQVDGCQLFRLLGVQLIEQLAASCGAVAARARFYVDDDALAKVAILRVHPMTAVLAAVRHLSSGEQAKLLAEVDEREIISAPLPELAAQWLSDLGYMGDPASMLTNEPSTISAIRTRLVAKLRVSTQQDFDPSSSPVPIDARKEDSVRPAARSVADYLTLALLFSGALKLRDLDRASVAKPELARVSMSDASALRDALREPLSEIPEAMQPDSSDPVSVAIRRYLEEPREPRAAARTAIWGPGAEITDSPALSQLMTLYLTLKPESSDAAVLDVKTSDSAEVIASSHTNYQRFLDEVAAQLTDSLAQARLAELRKRIDDALYALVPNLDPATGSYAARKPRPAAAGTSSSGDITQPLAAGAEPRPSLDPEAMMRAVEARVREGNWQKVIETIEPAEKGRALSPTLSLARALAERELARQPIERRSKRLLGLAFAIGLVLGLLFARVGAAMLSAAR